MQSPQLTTAARPCHGPYLAQACCKRSKAANARIQDADFCFRSPARNINEKSAVARSTPKKRPSTYPRSRRSLQAERRARTSGLPIKWQEHITFCQDEPDLMTVPRKSNKVMASNDPTMNDHHTTRCRILQQIKEVLADRDIECGELVFQDRAVITLAELGYSCFLSLKLLFLTLLLYTHLFGFLLLAVGKSATPCACLRRKPSWRPRFQGEGCLAHLCVK